MICTAFLMRSVPSQPSPVSLPEIEKPVKIRRAST